MSTSSSDQVGMSIAQAKRRLLEFGVLADEREREARAKMSIWAVAASVLGGAGTFMSLASLFRGKGKHDHDENGDHGGSRGGLVRKALGFAAPLAIKFIMGRVGGGRDQRGW